MSGRRVEQPTSAVVIVATLRDQILNGDIPPGHHLREVALASSMGVSRAPVREALAKLVDDGFVVKVPYKGTYVAEARPRVVDEIAGLRARLEPYAMERARGRATRTARSELSRALSRLRSSVVGDEVVAITAAHLRYHRLFYELAEHSILLQLWDSWESRLQLALARDANVFGGPQDLLVAHVRLHEAFLSGDASLLEREVRRHVLGPTTGP